MRLGEIKRYVISGVLVIFIMLVSIQGCGLVKSEPLKVGAPAPDFTFPTIDGQTVQLSKLRGQPVLVNFWATWCPPCRAEMPSLQAAFEEKGEEVKFIAVDLQEGLETVQQFAEDFGLSFTIALDYGGNSQADYNLRGIPETFLIDEQGIVRYIKIGPFLNKDELINLLEILSGVG
jgi:peroxiredoxin